MKIHQHNAGHMGHWADFDESLYEASETEALYILFKL